MAYLAWLWFLFIGDCVIVSVDNFNGDVTGWTFMFILFAWFQKYALMAELANIEKGRAEARPE